MEYCLLQLHALKLFYGVRLHGGFQPNFNFSNVKPQIFQRNRKIHLSNCLYYGLLSALEIGVFGGNALRWGLSKRSKALFTRVFEKTKGNLEWLGNLARLEIEPGRFVLPFWEQNYSAPVESTRKREEKYKKSKWLMLAFVSFKNVMGSSENCMLFAAIHKFYLGYYGMDCIIFN